MSDFAKRIMNDVLESRRPVSQTELMEARFGNAAAEGYEDEVIGNKGVTILSLNKAVKKAKKNNAEPETIAALETLLRRISAKR